MRDLVLDAQAATADALAKVKAAQQEKEARRARRLLGGSEW